MLLWIDPSLTGAVAPLGSHVNRNKPIRAAARIGVSGKHHPNSPETPPRATRLDGLIPAYALMVVTRSKGMQYQPQTGRGSTIRNKYLQRKQIWLNAQYVIQEKGKDSV